MWSTNLLSTIFTEDSVFETTSISKGFATKMHTVGAQYENQNARFLRVEHKKCEKNT